MFCENCGKQIVGNVKFCPSCGKQINLQEEHTGSGEIVNNAKYESPKPSNSKKKIGIVIGIIAAAVIAVLICIFVMPKLISANNEKKGRKTVEKFCECVSNGDYESAKSYLSGELLTQFETIEEYIEPLVEKGIHLYYDDDNYSWDDFTNDLRSAFTGNWWKANVSLSESDMKLLDVMIRMRENGYSINYAIYFAEYKTTSVGVICEPWDYTFVVETSNGKASIDSCYPT